MPKIERPKFAPNLEFHLERIQNKADADAWGQLEPLLVPSNPSQRIQVAQRNPYLPSRPLPKQPQQILLTIRGYARTLYISEGNMYQAGPQLEAQLRALTRRIVTRVMRTINALQTEGLSFEYHGVTDRKMRAAIVSDVNDMIDSRLSPPPRVVTRAPPPPSVVGGHAYASYKRSGVDVSSKSPLLIEAMKSSIDATVNARKAFVGPLLLDKGWSILDCVR
jgi:hypothetical protein